MKRGYLIVALAAAAIVGGVALARGRAQRQYALDRALYAAVEAGDAGRVRAVLARGADPNVREKPGPRPSNPRQWLDIVLHPERGKPTGSTALMEAAWKGHTDVVRQLLAAGADPNAADVTDQDVTTALDCAVCGSHNEAALLLLNAGASANLAGDADSTPLWHAVSYGCSGSVVDALLKHGARFDPRTLYGKQLLYDAARSADGSGLLHLLDRGGDVRMRNDDGDTLLIEAASAGNSRTVRALIERGAQVNAQDTDGATALRWAKTWRHRFRAKGASDRDLAGLTAVIALLKAHGAKE